MSVPLSLESQDLKALTLRQDSELHPNMPSNVEKTPHLTAKFFTGQRALLKLGAREEAENIAYRR